MHKVNERMHNKTECTTQGRYCANIVYSTEITWTSYAKIHSRGVTKKLRILQSMVSHKVTGYTVNKLTGYMNIPFSLQWETAYLKTTGEGPQNL